MRGFFCTTISCRILYLSPTFYSLENEKTKKATFSLYHATCL